MGLFSFLQASEPELQLYGKLPLAKDYLRIGLSDAVGVEWRTWMDKNFSTAVEQGAPRQLNWPVGFVRVPRRGNSLIGCMWNSTDAGGHRKFPISLAIHKGKKDLIPSLASGMIGLVATWSRLDEFRARALACSNGEQLMSELRGKQVVADAQLRTTRANVGLEEWCERLWPNEGPLGLRLAYKALKETASESGVRLRITLIPNLSWAQQIHAWQALLEGSGWLAVDQPLSLFVHYTAGAGQGGAGIFITREGLSSPDAQRLCTSVGDSEGAQLVDIGQPGDLTELGGESAAPYPIEMPLAQAVLRALEVGE